MNKMKYKLCARSMFVFNAVLQSKREYISWNGSTVHTCGCTHEDTGSYPGSVVPMNSSFLSLSMLMMPPFSSCFFFRAAISRCHCLSFALAWNLPYKEEDKFQSNAHCTAPHAVESNVCAKQALFPVEWRLLDNPYCECTIQCSTHSWWIRAKDTVLYSTATVMVGALFPDAL